MKVFNLTIFAVSLLLSAGMFCGGTTSAADKVVATESPSIKRNVHNSGPEEIIFKGGFATLGTKFIGMNIENAQGDNLGEIKDIVIDSTGKVRYAVVSYGGLFGMGDKLFAVPLNAFKLKRDKDLFFDDFTLILNVTKEQLAMDKGFDKDNWPDLNNPTYQAKVNKYYYIKQ